MHFQKFGGLNEIERFHCYRLKVIGFLSFLIMVVAHRIAHSVALRVEKITLESAHLEARFPPELSAAEAIARSLSQ